MVARFVVAYDGTPFAGWAAQPAERTVQGELERALATVLRVEVHTTAAGRTDRGVHALGQVVSYEGSLPRLRSVNAVLPDEIVVLAAEEAPDGFSARHDARSRSYVYRVLARAEPSPFELHRALWWPYPLDEDALGACAAALAGTHDFTAFTPAETYHVRFERDVFSAGWERAGDVARVPHRGRHVHAPDEPRSGGHDARGRRGAAQRRGVRRAAAGAPRSEAGRTAPAHGLYLESVRYD